MTVFFIICTLLMTLAVVLLVRPLLRPDAVATASEPTMQALSATVLRDQLQQLDADLASGQIDATEFESVKAELQSRALVELVDHPSASVSKNAPSTAKSTAWMVGLGIPVLGLAMYLWLGSPVSLDPAAARQSQTDAETKMIGGMVEKLATRLATNPDDVEGWARLARSYKVLGKLNESAMAYEKARPLVDKQPDLLVDYAEVLARLDQNDLNKRANVLIDKARKLDPKHPMALVISGAAAYQRDDFELAAKTWEQLIPLIEPSSEDAKQVLTNIADAKEKAALKKQLMSGKNPQK